MDAAQIQDDPLPEIVKKPFLDIATDISGALVYLDDGASEVAHLSLGASFLLGLGAVNVCSLEAASTTDAQLAYLCHDPEGCKHIVIFVTRLLTDSHRWILQAIQAHPKSSRVTLLCSITEQDHANQASTNLGYEAYIDYAAHLRDDLSAAAKQYHATPAQLPDISIRHFPLDICALDATCFVLPAASGAVTLGRAGGRAAGFGAADDFHDDSDGQGNSPGLALLSSSLAAISVQLGYRPEGVFHLGPVSHQVAHDLAHAPPLPGQDALTRRLAIVLVDRDLDLASPLLHQEQLTDAMMAGLPRRQAAVAPAAPGSRRSSRDAASAAAAAVPPAGFRPVDVRVDAPQCYPTAGPVMPGQLLGLELFHPADKRAQQQLQQLMARKGKEGPVQVRKWLKDGLRQEGLVPSLRSKAGAVPPAELKTLATDLTANPGSCVRQRGVIALGMGAAEALAGPCSSSWEAMAGLQKQLMMALAEAEALGGGSSSVLDFFMDAISSARQHKGLIQLPHVLQLLALAYTLAGDAKPPQPPLYPQQEQRVRAALLDALLEAPPEELAALPALAATASSGASGAAPASGFSAPEMQQQQSRQQLAGLLDGFFSGLALALQTRSKLRDFSMLRQGEDPATGAAAVTPLLRQLACKIMVRGEQRDVQQARQRHGMVSGFMKGLMKGHHEEPGLHEYDAVMLFVVGGISLWEVREVRAELEQPCIFERPKVLLGGSALLSPADVAAHLLG